MSCGCRRTAGEFGRHSPAAQEPTKLLSNIVEQCATDSAQITSVHEQLVSLVDSAEQLVSQSVRSTAGLERQSSNNGEKTIGQDMPAPQLHSSPVAAFPVCRADNQSSEHVTLSKSAAINFPFRNSSFPGIIMSMYRKPKATLLFFPIK